VSKVEVWDHQAYGLFTVDALADGPRPGSSRHRVHGGSALDEPDDPARDLVVDRRLADDAEQHAFT
jgi:hypothetical protein